MQHQTLTRALSSDLEIRSSGDGRTVHGIVVPFDSPSDIRDYDGEYTETFKRGTFARSIAEAGYRVKLLAQHNRQTMPLGRAMSLREDAAGLYGEFRVSATQAGDEVLELIRDGALDSFSVGFTPIRETWNRNKTERTHYEAKLNEVSVVNFPAYESAKIAGIRAAQLPQLDSQQLAARLGLRKATYGL
ncbi:MAG: HK97 family phage prohead protease [Rhodococcus qingshengii]